MMRDSVKRVMPKTPLSFSPFLLFLFLFVATVGPVTCSEAGQNKNGGDAKEGKATTVVAEDGNRLSILGQEMRAFAKSQLDDKGVFGVVKSVTNDLGKALAERPRSRLGTTRMRMRVSVDCSFLQADCRVDCQVDVRLVQ